ncbi:MAG: SGNH/GDSL hydrolase family protein [Planctomycetota bacterium]|nr:SGNH/GDSL hydrolase family protein [Planctomycetota bacterium]
MIGTTGTPEDSMIDPANPRTQLQARKISLFKKLAFLGVVLAVFCLLAEGFLIVLGISFPILYQPDDFCATRLRPRLNVRYTEEGNAVVQTNSNSFRGEETSKVKPEATYRIAIVGDSFCEGIQVDQDKNYCSILEQILTKRKFQTEVLNFGVSGFGTAQEYEMLHHYVLDYEPDLVILSMFLGNDVGDNSREINTGQVKPYYELVDGQLKLDRSFTSDARFVNAKSWMTQAKAALINSSRGIQLLNKCYSRFRHQNQPASNIGIGLNPKLYQPPVNDKWRQAWRVTEQLVKAFDRKCSLAGADCLVFTVSNPIQVHPDPEVRNQFKIDHGLASLFYPDDRLSRFCNANNIALLPLARKLLADVQDAESSVYYHGFSNTEMGSGHWNEQGHQRAAELLAEYLLKNTLQR